MEKVIYPTIKTCYCGTYNLNRKKTAWQVNIRYKDVCYYKTFADEYKALEHLKEKNIEFDLPIKNIIRDAGDHYTMDVKGNTVKFDKEDVHLVQSHCWGIHDQNVKSKYVTTHTNSVRVKLHNKIINHTPTTDSTIDHINQDPLDNRRVNLRVATKRQQMTNRRVQRSNTSGHSGVHKSIEKYWIARWTDSDGVRKSKSFNIAKYGDEEAKQMCIDYRQAVIKGLSHYN